MEKEDWEVRWSSREWSSRGCSDREERGKKEEKTTKERWRQEWECVGGGRGAANLEILIINEILEMRAYQAEINH